MAPPQIEMGNPGLDSNILTVVYAQYQRSEPFAFEIFEGFSSLRVLTYSASIPMTVKMVNRFDTVECVFGYEGVLGDFGSILACQQELSKNILMAVKGLDDERQRFLLEKAAYGAIRFFVVKGAVAHSKIYLLQNNTSRRVIVGSANLSDRAFSGKQAETLIIFDNDEAAWDHYESAYEVVREGATSEFTLPDLTRTGVAFEEIPVVQEAQDSRNGLMLFVNGDPAIATIPTVIHSVEKLSESYNKITKPIVRPKGNEFLITREVVGKIVRLVKSGKRQEQAQEPTWFSIQRDTQKVLFSGKEVLLDAEPKQIQSDVECLIEYFENFKRGFHGAVAQHQKDYFMFMCWLYFSPFICDLRNHAIGAQEYIFDYPMFAVLYGKSNCGKTKLMETLMKSMFGHWQFVDKGHLTRSNLRDLLHTAKRFPIVFDDVDRKRFAEHASDIIKDETLILEEYPTFVLSMNADNHSFPTEISKRCLVLYTKASLPDNADTARVLYKSVTSIQNRLSTALYREYLKRALERLATEVVPSDMLKFSSEILCGIFAEYYSGVLPAWCLPMSINEYQGRKYEKIQTELRKIYRTNPEIWKINRDEVILTVPQFESSGFKKEIPDWLLKEGSRAGNIVMDKELLEQFLGMSFKRGWLRFWRRGS
jgi:hypothetical protein